VVAVPNVKDVFATHYTCGLFRRGASMNGFWSVYTRYHSLILTPAAVPIQRVMTRSFIALASTE
jgi:hypothetical protein